MTEIEPDQPNSARIYNYMLGGKDYFPADVAAAQKLIKASPYFQPASKENRHFLRRAVQYLTGLGITQFLDIGTGLPTNGNVHEVAPDSRVVYVDNDPVVLIHAQALMADTDRVRVVAGDVRDPKHILTDPTVRDFLDWDQPIGLLMISVLHFVSDEDGAHEAVAQFRDAMPPGSYLAISHGSLDGFEEERGEKIEKVYQRSTQQASLRPKAGILRLFGDCPLVEPGLVSIPRWHPDGVTEGVPPERIGIYGGIGQMSSTGV
ncbi:SAM-dependent methyltransferase [Streptosporangium canum]|uniref:SAM-dependent methyltransferase n=1 Tax=Streptosporangium canum TaxID=324952 RepID=UPI00379272ED